MVVDRILVICVDIASLARYMRFARVLIRKSTATNLSGFVCRVSARFHLSALRPQSLKMHEINLFMTTFRLFRQLAHRE